MNDEIKIVEILLITNESFHNGISGLKNGLSSAAWASPHNNIAYGMFLLANRPCTPTEFTSTFQNENVTHDYMPVISYFLLKK